MTPEETLINLLHRLAAVSDTVVLVANDELQLGPSEAVAALKSQGLLTKAESARSTICPGCEQQCVMPVETQRSEFRDPSSFIVCDKRGDINRVPLSPERLVQWRCSVRAVCHFVADQLGLRQTIKF